MKTAQMKKKRTFEMTQAKRKMVSAHWQTAPPLFFIQEALAVLHMTASLQTSSQQLLFINIARHGELKLLIISTGKL